MSANKSPSETLPKIIWAFWFQGMEHAPKVVRKSLESWKLRNPDWDLRVLDSNTVANYLDLNSILSRESMDLLPKQAFADIVRINLIEQYGGVWVDATCFCCQPLDTWIHDYTRSGFFAFLGHRKDTLISNWFLSSHKKCYLTSTLCKEINEYWQTYPKTTKRPKTYRALKMLLNQHLWLTQFWFSKPVARYLGMKPYFWFQYLFNKLSRTDKKFSEIWNNTPKLDADIPHKLQKFGLLKPPSEALIREINRNQDKVYKLNWKLHKFNPKCDANTYPDDSVIAYILNSINRQTRQDAL